MQWDSTTVESSYADDMLMMQQAASWLEVISFHGKVKHIGLLNADSESLGYILAQREF